MKPVSFVGDARCGRTGDVLGSVSEMHTHRKYCRSLFKVTPQPPELQLTFDFLRKVTLKNLIFLFHFRASGTPAAIRKEMTLEELDALLAKRKEDRRKQGDTPACMEVVVKRSIVEWT